MGSAGSLTDVRGVRVGHATDAIGATGCTVILCERGAVGGVDVRGSAAGTRELAVLSPAHIAPVVHGVVLAGGSAFGLEAAGGVMQHLEARDVGLETPAGRVPIVVGAILYDLAIGNRRVRPTAAMGRAAAAEASTGAVQEGSVGAGTGATVGKLLGMERATKGGVGTASRQLGDGVVVAALVVVNAYGDVIDPSSDVVVAGTRRSPRGRRFLGTTRQLLSDGAAGPAIGFGCNTTLAVVATNARLDKVGASKVASVGHDGLARAVSPAHMTVDGDIVFSLATGSRRSNVDRVASAGAFLVAQATVRAVRLARTIGNVPALRDLG